MDKALLKRLLEREDIKKDGKRHFYVKAYELVIEEYGGKINDWYAGFPNNEENPEIMKLFEYFKNNEDLPNEDENEDKNEDEKSDKNKIEIRLHRVKDNRLDTISLICEYDSSKNKKVISHYKSTLSFKNIVSINVDSENIIIKTSFSSTTYAHLTPYIKHDEEFEKFHKLLIRKYDEYCDVEYNYFKQH